MRANASPTCKYYDLALQSLASAPVFGSLYQAWRQRDLSQKRYVYWWADGIYFNVRLEDARPCVLVVVGAREDGTKELLALADGFRESKDSWLELLRDLKAHGLTQGPRLALADGALGFWQALQEAFDPGVEQQRCSRSQNGQRAG